MSRAPNFAYQSPIADIGSSLVRAVLGDPTAAAKQREQQAVAEQRAAQAEEARAHSGLYTSQTTGQDTANTAQTGLPDLVRRWVASQQPAPPAPTVSSPAFANFDQPIPEAPARPDAGESLANVVAAMGQMNGQHVDPTKIMGSLASFMGGDELARRGLIAQGHSPTADFAVTPERADQVAAAGQQAKLHQALGVATINNRDDIPVANIQAGASRYGADSRERSSNFATSTRANSARYATDAKSAGPAPGFDAITKVFPGATMHSGPRSAADNRRVDGVANSYHLGNTPGVMAYDLAAQPGMTVDEAARRIEAANPGVRVIEQRDETGRVGPHGQALGGWHFALQNVGGPAAGGRGGRAAATPKAPKPVNHATNAMLATALTDAVKAQGIVLTDQAKAVIMPAVTAEYQRSGNPSAAAHIFAERYVAARRQRGQDGAPAVAAPDGVSPEQAAQLPVGTVFIGIDGKSRTRH